MNKLAINGGKRFLEVDVKEAWPIINDEIESAVISQLHSTISIYDRSNIIKELEDSFAKFYKKKYSLLVNSGTSAIFSALWGLNLSKNDEVIFPAYTFFATVSPIFFTGAIPVLVDCDANGSIDYNKIEKVITEKTKAIVVTDMWGIPVNYIEIEKIANKYDLYLLSDQSHGHGAYYNGERAGGSADIIMLSLQGKKIISGGEGGIMLTDNSEVYYRSLLLGQYNNRPKTEIPKDHKMYKYCTTGFGLKLRSHPIANSIALVLLNNIETIHNNKIESISKYKKYLNELPGLDFIEGADNSEQSGYSAIFVYSGDELWDISRETFVEALHAEGAVSIDIPNSTCPLNLLPLFQDASLAFPGYSTWKGYSKGDFPYAEDFHRKIIKFPVWTEKTNIKTQMYIDVVTKVINNKNELRRG